MSAFNALPSRRQFLAGSIAAGAAASAAPVLAAAKSRSYRRIACEEAFIIPEIRAALSRLAGGKPSMRSGPIAGPFMDALLDLGDSRIAKMRAAGIDMAVLSVSSPGVQMFQPQEALELAALANDRLAAAIARHPRSFAGLATLAPQAAERSAIEFERAVKTLGLKGGIINSSTGDQYLDHPSQRPLLEAAAAMDVPLYVHPNITSPSMGPAPVIPGFSVGWNYAVEAGTNAIRLIASGVFDQLPKLRIILGHCGETIPLLLDRLDNRYFWETSLMHLPRLKRRPSEYFRDNFYVTTSGMNTAVPVRLSLETMGMRSVLFAADWPMEDQTAAVREIESIGLDQATMRAVFDSNPVRVFKLG